jgi:hypothetical protein
MIKRASPGSLSGGRSTTAEYRRRCPGFIFLFSGFSGLSTPGSERVPHYKSLWAGLIVGKLYTREYAVNTLQGTIKSQDQQHIRLMPAASRPMPFGFDNWHITELSIIFTVRDLLTL